MKIFSPEWFAQWYLWLDAVSPSMAAPMLALVQPVSTPISALLLGLIGATSPCQLSITTGRVALVVRDVSSSGTVIASALSQPLMPAADGIRKLLGPALLVSGLAIIGLIRIPIPLSERLLARLHLSSRSRGALGELGAGFMSSLCFCPTMFWLFFGAPFPWGCRVREGSYFQACLPSEPPCRCWSSLLLHRKAKRFWQVCTGTSMR